MIQKGASYKPYPFGVRQGSRVPKGFCMVKMLYNNDTLSGVDALPTCADTTITSQPSSTAFPRSAAT